MATIASMVFSIEARTASIEEAAKRTADVVEEMKQGFIESIVKADLLSDAIEKFAEVGVEAIKRVGEAIEHTIDLGNQLYEMSLRTGASVENLSALRYVASQTGIDFDAFNTTLYKMEQALGSSGAKAEEMQQHLTVIGLNLQTLKNEKPDQAFIDIVSALEAVKNRADQAAIGMAIFGRGFKDMAGLSEENIKELIAEANELGLVMDTKTAAAAHVAETAYKSLTMQFEALADRLGAELLPALVALEQLAIDAVKSLAEDASGVQNVFSGSLQSNIVNIGESIIQATAAMAGFAQGAIVGLQFVGDQAVRVGQAFINVADLALKVGTLGTIDEKGKTILDRTQASLHATYDALSLLKGGIDTTADVAGKAFAAVEGVADHMAGRFGEAFKKAQQTIQDFANRSHNAFGGVGADVDAAAKKSKELDDTMKNIAASEAAMVTAMSSVLAGPQQVLRQMATAEGNLRLPGINFNAPVQDMGKALLDSMNQTVLAMPDLSKAAHDHIAELLTPTPEKWTDVFKKLPDLLTQAFTGGGGLSGALKGFTNEITSSLFGDKGPLSGVTQGLGKFVTGLTGGLGKTVSGLLGGMASSLLPGLGGLLSGLASQAIDWIKGLFDHVPGDLKNLAFGYGVQLSDAVMKGIRQDMDTLHLTEQAATIFNASKLFPTVDANNFSAALKITRDSYVMLATHQLTVAQTNQVITDMWPKLAAAGTSALGVVDAKLVELIKLDQQYQTHNQQIADFLKTQATNGAQDFTDALGVTSAAYKQLADDAEKAKTAQGADLDAINADMKVQQGIIDATTVKSQGAADALGAAMAGTFDGLIAGGMSFADAIKQIGPGITSLGTILQHTGYQGGAAFTALNAEVALYNDKVAGPALQYTNSLAKGIVSLVNMGKLDQTTFQGLGSQITNTFNSLVAQGKDGGEVLVAMQDPLQTLWEEEQKFGYKADDATQALIDEAVQAGVVGEKHKSSTDQMIDGINQVDKDLQTLVHIFGVDMPGAIGNTAAAFAKIPKTVDVDVNQHYHSDGSPVGAGDNPGGDTSGPDQRAHSGAMVAKGRLLQFHRGTDWVRMHSGYLLGGETGMRLASDEVPAILQTGEAVLQRSAVNALGARAIAALNNAGSASASTAPSAASASATIDAPTVGAIQLTVHVTPPPGTTLQDMQAFAPAFLEGLRRDTGLMRTAITAIAKQAAA